ncbi:uncharacterized protein [Amphiura filiformis]|uniref:uncharacterized protein n=1 Tax=Amphiura filiformis TaxID=82378 RepID=UPI003B21C3EA
MLISPKTKCCVIEETKITHRTSYVSTITTTPKSSVMREIDTNLKENQTKQRKKQKKHKLTPEDIFMKREQNRLRSKAYRERRKLQLKTLQEEVILARLEADIAKKQAKMSSRRR